MWKHGCRCCISRMAVTCYLTWSYHLFHLLSYPYKKCSWKRKYHFFAALMVELLHSMEYEISWTSISSTVLLISGKENIQHSRGLKHLEPSKICLFNPLQKRHKNLSLLPLKFSGEFHNRYNMNFLNFLYFSPHTHCPFFHHWARKVLTAHTHTHTHTHTRKLAEL